MITPTRREKSEWAARTLPKLRDSDTPLGLRVGVLGKKWTLLILRHVATEHRPSFSAMLRAHPLLSRRVLSIRLKELQREGYLEKIVSNGNPHRPTYVLSDKGRDALPLLHAFSDLVKRYGEGVSVARGTDVRAEDVCFVHPDVSPGGSPVPSTVTWASLTVRPSPKVVMYKDHCEKCKAPLATNAEAYICSYECTWCRTCAESFDWSCPNCQGRLQPRARLAITGRVSRPVKSLNSP